jgi:hypothetical protein
MAEAGRDQAARVDARLTALLDAVAQQPTAKDLRELRQALRAMSTPTDHRHLFETIDQIAAAERPILIGPWTGEVGFELLYWIPFVAWARAQGGWRPEREIVVSRGGVASWYGGGSYTDALTLVSPDEFRAAVAEEKRKHRRPGAFDDRLIDAVRQLRQLADVDVLHPGLMFRAFAPYWSDEAGHARIEQFTRHGCLRPAPVDRPAGLPADYVAVRFYFSDCFPATDENRAFARATVSALAERSPVVVLNPGVTVDEHSDWRPDLPERVITIADGLAPERNLAVQSAVISGARAFVGTYGGYSYLAPLYGVPAVAFFSRPSFKLHHLNVAQRVFRDVGGGALTAIDVAQAGLVQASLGALVPA